MQDNSAFPKKQGLYDPAFEHDACGLGFIANIKGKKSHQIVQDGVTILKNLSHRGAVGADPKSGDGAGILIQIPDKFFRKECDKINIELPKPGDYGCGLLFMPINAEERNRVGSWIQYIVQEEGQKFLGFREVKINDSDIGGRAKSSRPDFEHVFIGRGKYTAKEDFEKKLFIIRKKIGHKVRGSDLFQKNYFYICSLSSKVLVYKGQLMPEQLDLFFPELLNKNVESAISLVHSRYSTNTFPSWALAHPFRMIAHNGEINTLRGNVNWYKAREKNFISDVLGEDLKKMMPNIVPHKSDSATFDLVLELLVQSGRTLPEALLMMVPEAFTGDKDMPQPKKDFYEYNSCLMEPWDGPATISFTDGRFIGALLDRNGLRPSRYWITKDDHVILASESGVLDIAPENIEYKGRLQPGKVFLLDIEEGKIIDDKYIKQNIINKKDYSGWIKENIINLNELPEVKKESSFNKETLLERQKAFGYTLEDLKILIKPMVIEGKEAIGSMGSDTPLAILSKRPQLLFNYFKQLFAQVTNPPIDPIREEIVMSSQVMLGSEGNLLASELLNKKRLKISHPILSNKELEKIKALDVEGLKSETLETVFNKENREVGLEKALQCLFKKAEEAIENGKTLLILSDRGVNSEKVAMPSLLAVSALHHHLIENGTRTKVSIISESGEPREMHHFAVMIGYGANAINPYLVYETIESELNSGMYETELSVEEGIKNYIKSTYKGLMKIISKMGISTIQSYCGAQIFEAVGLNDEFIERYFTATPTRIGGIGINKVASEMLMRHDRAYKDIDEEILDTGGDYQWRKDGEHHQINPDTIALLHQAVRTEDYNSFKVYSSRINERSTNLASIRGLLELRERNPIPIDEVEPVSQIVKRFATGAMSYGSISKEAHETLAVAMNRLGGFSNTGEGGEDPARFVREENGDWKRSRIKQVAQGRFGVTIEYLVNADQIQIKMAQGAKPGEGGQLPGHKVSKEIANTRYTTPGVGLISPPPHHDIYSIEDLSQLIFDLKNANPKADISVKLVSEIGVGTIAAGVAKGKADHILISGYEGGTGASPQTSVKHCGLPMELGIAEAQQVLVMNNLRGRVRLQADGQLKTGRDVIIAALLGADEYGFATTALLSMGCVMLRKCHLNACSVGIATQDPELRKKFVGKPEHVINFFNFIANEVRELLAQLGFRSLDEIIGRVDLLETNSLIKHWKATGLDLTAVLHKPEMARDVPTRNVRTQKHRLKKVLDQRLIESCQEALENKEEVRFSCKIRNTDRTVGTMLSSEMAKRYGIKGLDEDTIKIKFKGSAGQSFAAFLSKGITFTLDGDANDYVGKGLSGGRIIVYPPKESTFVPAENILIGNVVLYGAISGDAYFRGMAGERFAVRNSGGQAVIEGVGDHACEYMTGGRVVILGETGRNFAAGMSGGIAYVWDHSGEFRLKCNMEMVELFNVETEEDINELKGLITRHKKFTDSKRAEFILNSWDVELKNFVKVYPTDYRRIVEEQSLSAKEV
ncbi:MAG: glutamate synthase large subunit [Melioribacteraceae bacterium]|nr:glutamate synthase large subunit [Melioribacteraceae bacterium]